MGFPSKWRCWIMGILYAGSGRVLVNGSPTGSFNMERGLRQGDPISPFLFILALESLNIIMNKAVEDGLVSGLRLPNGGPLISHLFYADNVVFVGEGNLEHVKNLAWILRCFYVASGIRVSPSKSKVYGVGLDDSSMGRFAKALNCSVGSFPFIYLGMMVGSNMNIIANWKLVVDRFNSKLSRWKAKCLSLAGRVTLAKAVLSNLPTYYLSLYKAPTNVINTLEGIRRRFVWGGVSSKKNKMD
ncbi:putative RNA-directed DNA polymerase [Helianthus annuus]|nr:putative RNA-directed DNA polymerase [Helianthus annuus]